VAIVGEQRNMFPDNELKLMSEISENENITQRELSKRLNLSLGKEVSEDIWYGDS
jgi:uncharacterized membrane protein